jgi:hypothetical protein
MLNKSLLQFICFVIALLCLSSCATTEKYNTMIRQWVGQDEDTLIASWGAPTSNYQTDQAKYLTYDNIRQNIVPPTPSTVQVIRQGDAVFTRPIAGSPGYSYTTECRTTFTLQGKKIVNVNATGNACVM